MKKGVHYNYYISNRLSNGGSSRKDGWRITSKELEGAVLSTLRTILSNPLRVLEIVGENHSIKSIEEQNAVLEQAGPLNEELDCASIVRKKEIVCRLIARIELHPEKLILQFSKASLEDHEVNNHHGGCEQSIDRASNEELYQLETPHSLQRRGVEAKLILWELPPESRAPDQKLIELIAKAHS